MNVYESTMQNGGGTFSPYGNAVEFESGYMVALPRHEKIVSAEKSMLEKTFGLLFAVAKSLDTYIGTWLHEDKIYVDLSMHVENLDRALELGKLHKQIAIWDCKNQTEITLK